MIIPMLCVTIFVLLVVWFLLPSVARLMILTPTAISIFVCHSFPTRRSSDLGERLSRGALKIQSLPRIARLIEARDLAHHLGKCGKVRPNLVEIGRAHV